MAGSTPAAAGRIFISYRRSEADFPAGWLYDHLVAQFGRDQVFKDVDSIEPGEDFAEVIADAVGSCDVLLVLIGDRWLTISDEDGKRLRAASTAARSIDLPIMSSRATCASTV